MIIYTLPALRNRQLIAARKTTVGVLVLGLALGISPVTTIFIGGVVVASKADEFFQKNNLTPGELVLWDENQKLGRNYQNSKLAIEQNHWEQMVALGKHVDKEAQVLQNSFYEAKKKHPWWNKKALKELKELYEIEAQEMVQDEKDKLLKMQEANTVILQKLENTHNMALLELEKERLELQKTALELQKATLES